MANIYSLKSGLASDTTVWSGGAVPVSGDRVYIQPDHVVTVDGTYTWGDDSTSTITINGVTTYSSIYVRGTFKASRTASSSFTARGSLAIGDLGTLDYGTELDPIPVGVQANIIVNFSASMAHCKYGITTKSSFKGFRFWGVDKTPRTALTATALSTDTVVYVEESANWAVGDFLCFGVTDTGNKTSVVYRAIASISGLTVTLSGSLGNASQIGRTVLNLTRNVKVQSYLPLTWSSFAGFIADTNPVWTDTVEIGPSEFNLMGGTTSVYYKGGLNFTWGYLYTGTDVIKRVYRPVMHDVYSIVGSTVTPLIAGLGNTQLLNLYRNFGYTYTIEEPVLSSANNIPLITANAGCVVTIKDAHVVRSSYTPIITDYNAGFVINGGHFEAVEEAMVKGSMIDVTYNNTTFNGFGWLFRSLQVAGSLIYNNCNIGGQRGFFNSPAFIYLENNNIVKVNYNNCIVHPNMVLTRAINLATGNASSYYKFKNKNNDPDLQLMYKKGGLISKDVSTIYRGTSSLSMASWYSTAPLTHSTTVPAGVGEAVRIRGYVKFNTIYTTTTPPKVTISGLGITPVEVVAPAVADTWHEIDVTVTNPQAYPGEFAIDFWAQSPANTETAIAWFDGFVLEDFVLWTRKYGDFYDPYKIASTTDPFTVLSESAAAALTGISYAAGTVTITSDKTISQVYDWMQWYECSNQLEPIFTTTDGVNFTATCNITMTGANLTGTGVINMPTKTLTMTGGAISSVYIYALNGNTGYLNVTGLSAHSVLLQDGAGTQLDYQASVTGSYSYFVPVTATGTWKFTTKKAGYEHQTITFLSTTGGAFSSVVNTPAKVTADGLSMYTGASSALVDVSFSGTTQANIDIANGTATLQAAFDETEVALTTNNGLLWLASGKYDNAIFNSASGDYLFMADGWRLRRASAGDVNATLQAFAISTEGVVVDGVNGGVLFLTSDTPEAIAAAILPDLQVINRNVIKASKIIPATEVI